MNRDITVPLLAGTESLEGIDVGFEGDVTLWLRPGDPLIDYTFMYYDEDMNDFEISKSFTPAEALALAQRLVSAAVEAQRFDPSVRSSFREEIPAWGRTRP
jgi:hypothetical protein